MLRVPTKSTPEQRSNMQVIAPDKEVLTTKEVAAKLRVTPRTVYNMAPPGALPAFRVGRVWRFNAEDLKTLMETQRPTSRKGQAPTTCDSDAGSALDALLGPGHRRRKY
jgi:excisionase family DNA binding protein